ncbi:uncharacterized protein LOC129956584 [Argiope bruennichi]|uniref:uncharacterized protein LOC129956584 n=1 Tax=Argiope bruennichi TaxID=94029 RepID=UPI00249542F3|nr:uncharacterized protein LOC129956584 [Argiope bruennichi]
MVYGSARSTALRQLDTVHHTALRICSGAFRTSPVESLYVICHQPSLPLRRLKLSTLYYYRTRSVPNHPICHMNLPVGLRRLYNARPSHVLPFNERAKLLMRDSDLSNVTITTVDSFCFPPWDVPYISFLNPFAGFDKSSTASVVYQQLFLYHRCQYSSFTPIFTDGSRSDGHVGCGIIIPSDTLSYRLHNCCSVFTAELVAIFCALREILPLSERNFIIYTDSLSALETLSHYHYQMHTIAIQILCTLRLLENRGFKILFCWVPGHAGITGNERADFAAKSASLFLIQSLPYCDTKRSLVRHIFSKWQVEWDLQIHNKLHSVKPTVGLWPTLRQRENDVKMTRLRIGHTRYTHLHLLFGERAPICSKCHIEISIQHILIVCPNFEVHRRYFFHSSNLNIQDLDFP